MLDDLTLDEIINTLICSRSIFIKIRNIHGIYLILGTGRGMQDKLHNLQGQSSVMATRESEEKAKGTVLRAPYSIYISKDTAMHSSNTWLHGKYTK